MVRTFVDFSCSPLCQRCKQPWRGPCAGFCMGCTGIIWWCKGLHAQTLEYMRDNKNDFNVRFTNGKIYTYDIHLDKYRDPFTCRYRHVPKNPAELDIDAMREGCQSFVGLRDFRLLTNKTDRALESSERLIYQCKLGDIPGGIRVAVMGKGFLYKQVRNMVGVLIAVGYHKLDRNDIDILLQGDETKLYNQKSQYQVAEGKGLCLQRVFLLDEQLPDSIFPV